MDRSLREDLLGEVDDVWSETIRHLPLKGGVQDVDRARVEFHAILRTGDRRREGMNFGRGNNGRSSVMGDGGELRIDRDAFPDLIIKQGDKVAALDRTGAPVFEVMSVDDRSHLRLICELGDAN